MKLPIRPEDRAAAVEAFMNKGAPAQEAQPPAQSAPAEEVPVKKIRLTIDLAPDLHHAFKMACVRNKTKMVEEVTRFIEDWTQKHS